MAKGTSYVRNFLGYMTSAYSEFVTLRTKVVIDVKTFRRVIMTDIQNNRILEIVVSESDTQIKCATISAETPNFT